LLEYPHGRQNEKYARAYRQSPEPSRAKNSESW